MKDCPAWDWTTTSFEDWRTGVDDWVEVVEDVGMGKKTIASCIYNSCGKDDKANLCELPKADRQNPEVLLQTLDSGYEKRAEDSSYVSYREKTDYVPEK